MARVKSRRTRRGRARARPLLRKGPRGRILKAVGLMVAVIVLLPLLAMLLFRFVNPPFSMHMARQFLVGTEIHHRWVPIENISPNMLQAVVASEDARFCQHAGVDWAAVNDAMEAAERNGGQPRGASTIPMQTVKNLFLWSDRSYIRKAIELPLAYVMDAIWPKRRILEVYLNVAEWGPGIFGVEAAAQYHFKKSAARLTRREAALLAASLPNPHARRAGRPGPLTRRLASRIEARARGAGPLISCVKPEA